MFMTENNNTIYLDGKLMYTDDEDDEYYDKFFNTEEKSVSDHESVSDNRSEESVSDNSSEESVSDHDSEESVPDNSSEESVPDNSSEESTNFINNFMKGLLISFLLNLLAIYTNIDLYIKDKFNLNKEIIKLEDIQLTNEKSDYDYYSNNKIIASSKTLTNRKNYDFALTTHYTNVDINYIEVTLCHNKIKKRNIDICQKYFMSIYFSIDENDYEINLDDDNLNFYLTNNILDYTIISFIMLDKHNVSISNIPYNLIMIDDNSNVIELKETQYIRFYKNRYTIDSYD